MLKCDFGEKKKEKDGLHFQFFYKTLTGFISGKICSRLPVIVEIGFFRSVVIAGLGFDSFPNFGVLFPALAAVG